MSERSDKITAALKALQGQSQATRSFRLNPADARRAAAMEFAPTRAELKRAQERKAESARDKLPWYKKALVEVMESPVGEVLKTVDLGRSYFASHISDIAQQIEKGDAVGALGAAGRTFLPGGGVIGEIGDAVDGKGFNLGQALNSYENEKNRKDFWKHTGVGEYLHRGVKKHGLEDTILGNKWVDRTIGFVGDVGLDPLTYVTGGIEGGAKAVADQIVMKQGARVAEEAVARAAKEGLDEAARAAVRETALGEAKNVAARVLKKGKSSLTPDEARLYFPDARHGLHIRMPGTGKIGQKVFKTEEKAMRLLPKELTDPLTRTLAVPRNAIGNSTMAAKVGSKLGGQVPELREMLRSGDPARVVEALGVDAQKRTQNALEAAGMRLLPDNSFNAFEGASSTADEAARGLHVTDVWRKHVVPAMKNPEEAIKAVETASTRADLAGVPGATELHDFLVDVAKAADASGVKFNKLENYVPRVVREEVYGKYDPTKGRTLFPKEGQDLNSFREFMNTVVAPEMGLNKGFYETDVNKMMDAYLGAMNRRVARSRSMDVLRERGLLTDVSGLPSEEARAALEAQRNKLGKIRQQTAREIKRLLAKGDKAKARALQKLQEALPHAEEIIANGGYLSPEAMAALEQVGGVKGAATVQEALDELLPQAAPGGAPVGSEAARAPAGGQFLGSNQFSPLGRRQPFLFAPDTGAGSGGLSDELAAIIGKDTGAGDGVVWQEPQKLEPDFAKAQKQSDQVFATRAAKPHGSDPETAQALSDLIASDGSTPFEVGNTPNPTAIEDSIFNTELQNSLREGRIDLEAAAKHGLANDLLASPEGTAAQAAAARADDGLVAGMSASHVEQIGSRDFPEVFRDNGDGTVTAKMGVPKKVFGSDPIPLAEAQQRHEAIQAAFASREGVSSEQLKAITDQEALQSAAEDVRNMQENMIEHQQKGVLNPLEPVSSTDLLSKVGKLRRGWAADYAAAKAAGDEQALAALRAEYRQSVVDAVGQIKEFSAGVGRKGTLGNASAQGEKAFGKLASEPANLADLGIDTQQFAKGQVVDDPLFNEVMADLNPQERRVVEAILGGDRNAPRANAEIAADLGISTQRVGQVRKAALAKLAQEAPATGGGLEAALAEVIPPQGVEAALDEVLPPAQSPVEAALVEAQAPVAPAAEVPVAPEVPPVAPEVPPAAVMPEPVAPEPVAASVAPEAPVAPEAAPVAAGEPMAQSSELEMMRQYEELNQQSQDLLDQALALKAQGAPPEQYNAIAQQALALSERADGLANQMAEAAQRLQGAAPEAAAAMPEAAAVAPEVAAPAAPNAHDELLAESERIHAEAQQLEIDAAAATTPEAKRAVAERLEQNAKASAANSARIEAAAKAQQLVPDAATIPPGHVPISDVPVNQVVYHDPRNPGTWKISSKFHDQLGDVSFASRDEALAHVQNSGVHVDPSLIKKPKGRKVPMPKDSAEAVEQSVEVASKPGRPQQGDNEVIVQNALDTAQSSDVSEESVARALEPDAAQTTQRLESEAANPKTPKVKREKLKAAADASAERDKIVAAAERVVDRKVRAALALQAEAKRIEVQLNLAMGYERGVEWSAGMLRHPEAQQKLLDAIDSGALKVLNSNPSLAGSREIADIYNRLARIREPGGMTSFLRHWDAAVGYLKAWQLATPGFHVRNLMGGTFNNWLAGVDMGAGRAFWRDYKAWQQGTLQGEKAVKMAELADFLSGGQYSAAELGLSGRKTWKPWSRDFEPLRASSKAGNKVEFHLRGSLGWDRITKGGTVQDALADIVKFHFDYADLSQFERGIKRVIPFYTWSRHNLPLQMEMILQVPGKYARYQQFKQEMEWGVEDDKLVPDYFTNGLFGIKSPFTVGGSRLYITPDLPFTQTVENSLPETSGFDPLRAKSYTGLADNYLSQVTPLIKLPLELQRDKQFFKGIPLPKDYKNVDAPFGMNNAAGDALGSFVGGKQKAAYILEQLFPGYQRARRYAPTEKKYKSRQFSSLASAFGIPIRTNTPYEQRVEKQRRDRERAQRNG